MRFILLSIFLAGWCCKLNAQLSPRRFIAPQYTFEYLPVNTPTDYGIFSDAIEDNDGFLWLSGTKGLHVFDGESLISYTNGDPEYPLRPGNETENYGTFVQGRAGLLWLQEYASHGIICFDPRKRTVVFGQRSWLGLEGMLHLISIAPSGDFVSLYRNAQWDQCAIYKGWQHHGDAPIWQGALQPMNWTCFLYTPGYHWLISGGHIIRISETTYSIKEYHLPLPNANVHHAVTESGRLYLLDSQTKHIYTWDSVKDSIVVYMNLPPQMHGRSLVHAMDRKFVYLGSFNEFYLINREEQTIQDLSPSLLQLRREENGATLGTDLCKILPTRDNGVFYLSSQSIMRLKTGVPPTDQLLQRVRGDDPRHPPLSFRQLAEDEQHNIYASYYAGIAIKKRGQSDFIPFLVPGSPIRKSMSAYSLNYWKGHLLYNNIMIDRTTRYSRLLGHQYYGAHTAQYLDHDTLWHYNWWSNYLVRTDLSNLRPTYYHLNVILDRAHEVIPEVNAITGDATGLNLWMGIKGYGIALVSKEGKLQRHYTTKDLGLGEEYELSVNALQPGPEGLWFGCSKGLGLLHAQTGKAELYYIPRIKNAAALDRAIFSIAPDTIGNLYLGSSSGLVYFDTRKKTFYTLPTGHPMEKIECNRNSAFRSSDNRFYFGTTNGLYSFLPGELNFNRLSGSVRPIKIDNISVFNSASRTYRYLGANVDSCVHLESNDNSIDVHLSLPEYDEEVYYAYRLSEPDSKWTTYRPDNQIFLSYLPGGKHTLEIKASTDLKDNHASYYRLIFLVDQVWYKKAWNIILLCAAFCVLVLLTIRYRYNLKYQRQKGLSDLRTRISTDLHDDIGSVLSGLAMQSEMLTYSAKEEQKEPLIEISNMSRDVMESMRDIVWAMDSRKDHYENLVDRMRAFAEKSLGIRNIEHEFVIRDIQQRKFIDPEKRQNIYLIFKEAITNILKHSNARFVYIVMEQLGDQFHLSIRDNGTNPMPASASGMGISNMMMRAERIGGILTIKADNGIVVSLILHNE
ncbi:sensor histidine kinase [Taibaiella koreensis]|uniref:sensor histidine kinase n=1 Tax=Taibaiella koreensis TaxID=1268548 RepID=UPI0013C2B6BF|nr:histidine kinase [Taibaiella koreensis]